MTSPTPAFDRPASSAPGDQAREGFSAAFSRADHVHPRSDSFATTAEIADVAAAESAGTSPTVARGDHIHADPGKADWSTYTPTIGGTGWALGNGTISGRYVQDGKTVHLHVEITFGSTSTFGAGGMTVTLPPVNARASNLYGISSARDTSSTIRYPGICRTTSATVLQPLAILTNGGAGTYNSENGYTTTTPFTWANTDQVFLDITYEAA